MTTATTNEERALAERLRDAHARLRDELGRRIVGMQDVIELLLLGIFTGGHCLLNGVPGLAKTLLVRSLAELLDLRFSRIQFTPDLMPSDITGTEIIDDGDESADRRFKFMQGPVFANLLLADEINRTPPKTQAALIEAMEEHQVTSGGRRHVLDPPFFVLATQNPIEQEGTYPLPTTQLDRFMFNIRVDYPTAEDELRIVRLTTSLPETALSPVLTRQDILDLIRSIRRRPVPPAVIAYATAIGRATRPAEAGAPDCVRQYISWGAGPRAAQQLVFGARARALLHGRSEPGHADIRALVHPTLRHRITRNFSAEADGMTAETILEAVVATIPAPDLPAGQTSAPRRRFPGFRRRA